MTTPDLCVVVGATGAMGTEITLRLARRGLRVLAVARRGDELEKLAISDDLITPCVADIADDTAIDTISACIDSPVRMALFAAGLPVRGSVDTIPPGDLAVATNIKVGGLVRLLHAVRDHLVDGSRFVTIAGSLGLEPGPLDAAPGTANAAVFNLMRQLSALYGPKGVTTHTIAPGPVDTPRLRAFVETESAETGQDPEKIWNRYRAKTSLGRLPTLQEIGWIVETLLAPEAAVLHGSVINVDAGTRHGIH
ncbi:MULTISPECIES: SDR family NAD(P)-dependent oxidoreductase [Rhodococcus]|uniref:Short chain dehydrogenase n=2 Tax=Rhodococcus opacus TaxID=37919 RepID=A0A1B1JX51_RHOOP|nr:MULTISPECIES: SDR family oxidoreductase [Rhodococcus]NHU44718.1 SDR family oxidoreductase [Rhodococcus sp. A14]ANS24932.1 short chain dehydrogenase [Rhodococcus opacus]EID81110.1 short chain dehydrogenase [Rhodococcus opacus RKJ300 = JCM 13270]EJI97405.1 short chain dehydrogenase family protein [Rhodococcus sp. JVH1]MBA8960854.1 NAD(P)-dependent dehydrogenase (short-subunit alcohol dehydrogenase family) [Rhodococcus opacus]